MKVGKVDKKVVKKTVESKSSKLNSVTDEQSLKLNWQEELLGILYKIPPSSFERLCQRMLRELGFMNVEVLGKSGDGGIDGKGIFRINKLISFPIVFQCKRYKGSISAPIVRDFRGAMSGRADKGLIMTTGNFTFEAKKEAQREGVSYIDLIDGTQFSENLRDLGLVVKSITNGRIMVDREFLESI